MRNFAWAVVQPQGLDMKWRSKKNDSMIVKTIGNYQRFITDMSFAQLNQRSEAVILFGCSGIPVSIDCGGAEMSLPQSLFSCATRCATIECFQWWSQTSGVSFFAASKDGNLRTVTTKGKINWESWNRITGRSSRIEQIFCVGGAQPERGAEGAWKVTKICKTKLTRRPAQMSPAYLFQKATLCVNLSHGDPKLHPRSATGCPTPQDVGLLMQKWVSLDCEAANMQL
eukprot:s1789_g18.t1